MKFNLFCFFVFFMAAPKPPEFYIKTGLHIEPIPSNEELWATGLVAHLWNIYSNHLTEYGNVLTRTDQASRRVFRETIGIKQRVKLVRALIRRYAKPEYHKQWIDIIDRGGSLQIHRDKIVHGDWGGAPYDVATKEIVGVKHLYDHFQQKGDYTWKLDYDAIFNVAKQIDKLVLDCFLFSMELMRPEDGDDVRPSLLHRLVSPDRPLSHRDRIASYLPNSIGRLIRPKS
jgi:hypothetical protein